MGVEPAHDQRDDDGHTQKDGAMRRAGVGVDRSQIADPRCSCRPQQEDSEQLRPGRAHKGQSQPAACVRRTLERSWQLGPATSPPPCARYVHFVPRIANTSFRNCGRNRLEFRDRPTAGRTVTPRRKSSYDTGEDAATSAEGTYNEGALHRALWMMSLWRWTPSVSVGVGSGARYLSRRPKENSVANVLAIGYPDEHTAAQAAEKLARPREDLRIQPDSLAVVVR